MVMERPALVWHLWAMNDLFINVAYRKSFLQLIRYGLVGLAINLTGYLVYLLITHIGGTPKTTMSILYAMGIVLAYFGNRKLTFDHQGSVLASGTRFLITQFSGYIINLLILIIMVDKLGYDHRWVQAIAILVVAAFLFTAFKFFVFKERDDPGRG